MHSYSNEPYIRHYGILGMRWGVRRYQNKDGTLTAAGKRRESRPDYRSTSLKSALARRRNRKVDESFDRWKESDNAKKKAIEAGKKRNSDRIAYERDRSNKDLRRQYKQSDKAYRKALRANTTYRKGSVRKEVGQDASRRYLSEAKRVAKQMKADPKNRDLRKRYTSLMNSYDVERSNARRAEGVASTRSAFIAGGKRLATITVKTAAASAAIGLGTQYVSQRYGLSISADAVQDAIRMGRKALRFMY